MKRFLILISTAVILTVICGLTLLSVSAGTDIEVSDNVIFISDTAATDGVVGDGKSASKPLDPSAVSSDLISETTNDAGVTSGRYYYRTALYQAAEKLVETGGTIVICGPVNIGAAQSYGTGTSNRDFFFPISQQPIRITSVYDGVNYATTKGAYLGIASPAQITMNAPSIFENMTIKTTGIDRVICANGNKIVMGDGIECVSTASSPTGSDYVSVVGGSRYLSLASDTDVVIKSGYYSFIGGAQWGLDGDYTHKGNVNITIMGGTTRNPICGGAVKSSTATLDGDVTISIYPAARIGMAIYGSGQGQFANAGHTVKINIYGGAYYDGSASVNKNLIVKTSANTNPNYQADKYILNVSNASLTTRTAGSTKARLLNNFVTTATQAGYDEIRYPAVWLTGYNVVSAPAASRVFAGESVSSEGAVLQASYKNSYDGTTTYSCTLAYDEDDTAYRAECNTSSEGMSSVNYFYGYYKYATGSVNVVSVPEVTVHGAKIKTSGDKQALRFIAEYTGDLSDGVTIEEYGVLAMRADLFLDDSKLNFEQTVGMNVITPAETDINESIGGGRIYSCTLTGIPQNRFNIDTIARAYIKLNVNGETVYRYSDIVRKNPYKIAKLASANSEETAATKTYLAEKVIGVHENYSIYNSYADSTYLRNKVVNYMRSQMELTWTPSKSFWINNPSDAAGVTTNLYFEAGKTYKGIPYTNYMFSQKETFGDLVADGVLDISEIPGLTACGNTTADLTVARENYLKFPGSDCSTAVITAWNTVLNNRPTLKNLTQTKYMVPGNNCGVIPVGDYKYDYDTYKNNTYAMTGDAANGAKVYAAYSKLRPGDAIVHYNADNGAGHTRLVVSVNKTAKTVTTIECANWSIPKCTVTSGNNNKVTLTNNNTSWMELTYHFDYLLKDGYVPITIPELVTGNSDSEYTLATNMNLASDLPNGKLDGDVISNRQIISVNIRVSDGTKIQTINYIPSATTKSSVVHMAEVDLGMIDMSTIKLESGKKYTFDLDVRVVGLTTTTPTVKLVKGYEFTAN